jgi:hypothetical protein
VADKKYVIKSMHVDPCTVVRKRVTLTPDRCRICGFSVCERNGLEDFDQLDSSTQARVRKALAAHRDTAHPNASRPVVGEAELPRQWLGDQPDDPRKRRAQPAAQSDRAMPPPVNDVGGWPVNKQPLVTMDGD